MNNLIVATYFPETSPQLVLLFPLIYKIEKKFVTDEIAEMEVLNINITINKIIRKLEKTYLPICRI